MGVLTLFYLTLLSAYISVDAPSRRGFSLIEIWFVGTQAPVFFAILEYAMVLAAIKFGNFAQNDCFIVIKNKLFAEDKKISYKHFIKMIDLLSFICSLIYLVIFGIFYCRE